MGRRSRRRDTRYGNDQVGCMWGLISIFDFRSTRKLLLDKRHASQNAGSSCVDTKLKMLTYPDEKLKSSEEKIKGSENSEISKADVVKTSVKELMEEEMFIEEDSDNHIEIENKSFKESCGGNTVDFGELRDENLDNLDLEGILEELCHYHQKTPGSDFEEKLSAAIKVFTDERFKEDSKTHHSKEFVEALKTLSSNKELFLNLLKDPNSPLVKHIQSIDDSRLGKEQSKSRTHRSFFRRRSKSQESNSFGENEKQQPSNRIVILKPGPTTQENHNNRKSVSQFSFTGIKRKLKHAMGKEKLGESRLMSEKGVLEERIGWSSPNRNHFYIEKFAKPNNASKKEEKICKTLGVSNIYIEAKKHLSEMLTNGDEKEVMMTRQLPKTLGRVLALPEYNYSPWGSPAKDGKTGFVTAKMRLSPRLNIQTQPLVQEDNAIHLCSAKQEMESQLDNPNQKEESRNSCSSVTEGTALGPFMKDEIGFEGGVGTVIKEYEQENGFLITTVDESHNTDEVCEEERSFICAKEDAFKEDPSFSSPLVSPSSSPQTKNTGDRGKAVDKTERPSPVSVLEAFSDDEVSPSTTKSRPAIQPLHIRFDEGLCTRRACEENEESEFEYVEAVLLASGLNWDDYLSNQLSSNQLLHPSLFNEVELFSNRPVDDQKLLFDCMNEVLKEICEHYLDYSFTKHKVSPFPSGTSLIQQVWEGVEWHLLYSPPLHSLDQLVKKDMMKSGAWMDLRFETENLVIKLVHFILEEMVEETLFSMQKEKENKQSLSSMLLKV